MIIKVNNSEYDELELRETHSLCTFNVSRSSTVVETSMNSKQRVQKCM